MRRASIVMIGIFVTALAAPALADPPATTPAAATPPASPPPAAKPKKREPKPDDMICEEDASTTGSILSHRVCKTRAQREAETQAGQDSLRNNARIVPGQGRN